jgi:hypothetical protein
MGWQSSVLGEEHLHSIIFPTSNPQSISRLRMGPKKMATETRRKTSGLRHSRKSSPSLRQAEPPFLVRYSVSTQNEQESRLRGGCTATPTLAAGRPATARCWEGGEAEIVVKFYVRVRIDIYTYNHTMPARVTSMLPVRPATTKATASSTAAATTAVAAPACVAG